MASFLRRRRNRQAFTLVEMLTVIIIIGLLATLMLVAFQRARVNVRNATVKTDIKQIEMALERYRTEYGEYPPDFVGTADAFPLAIRTPARTAVLRHLAKRFPRLAIPGATVDLQFGAFIAAVQTATSDNNQNGIPGESGETGITVTTATPFNPSQALLFWLGGLPAYSTSGELTGFSANPANPFSPATVVASRTTPFYEFNTGQMFKYPSDAASPICYGALDAARVLQPYVYFRPVGNPYGSAVPANPNFNWYLGALSLMATPYSGSGVCASARRENWEGSVWSPVNIDAGTTSAVLPYVNVNSGGWAAQSGAQLIKPQIIWSGLDGDFTTHNDNIASFTLGTTVGDDK